MRKRFTSLIIMLLIASSALSMTAVNWRLKDYSITARMMDVRNVLESFGVAQGLPVIMSPSVKGVFSGVFKEMPSGEFLDKVATLHNLIWYCDGAAIYVYGAGEMLSELFDFKYTTVEEVESMLDELGLADKRYPIKSTKSAHLVMVSGPPRYVQLVGQTLIRAEVMKNTRNRAQVETRIFRLKHAWADNISFSTSSPETSLSLRGVASLLEEMVNDLDTGANPARFDPAYASTNATAAAAAGSAAGAQSADKSKKEGDTPKPPRPVIKADNRLNAVVVRDIAERMPVYERMIKELDVPQPLVEIGVTIIELSKDDALDWGMSLRAGGANSRRVNGAVGQNVDNLMGRDALDGKGISGALTFLGSDWNLDASLTALRTSGKARNITRTSLLTANNLAAEVTDMQTYHVRVVGERTATLQDVSAGMELRIKPRIVPSSVADKKDTIWLSIDLTDGGIVDDQDVDAMPLTRNSKVVTQAGVTEGESLLLAGNLRDVKSKAGWGIPWLRDIPWVGWIFGGASDTSSTVQRMFVLTPIKIDMDQDNVARFQATRQRDISDAENFEKDAEQSDNERELREQENKAQTERRREETDDKLKRRKYEIKRDSDQRQLDRARTDRKLDADRREWDGKLDAAKHQLKEENKALKEIGK